MTRFPSLMTQLRRGKTAPLSALMLAILVSACASAPASEPRRPTRCPSHRLSQSPPPARPAQQLPVPPVNPRPQPMPEPVPSRRVAPAELESRIHETWRTFSGRTGIAIHRIDGDWLIGKRQKNFFPSKAFPNCGFAVAILDHVDQGKLSLTTPVRVTSRRSGHVSVAIRRTGLSKWSG